MSKANIKNHQSEAIEVKAGERVPDSGIYEEVKSGQRATMVKGEHAPPTPGKNGCWRQVISAHPEQA